LGLSPSGRAMGGAWAKPGGRATSGRLNALPDAHAAGRKRLVSGSHHDRSWGGAVASANRIQA